MRLHSVRWIVAVLLFLASPVAAQERFGGLTGVVTDPQATALPGATVTATNKQTGAVRTTVTTADGTYQVPDLEPGRYAVVVELQGFTKLSADDVLVLLGRNTDFPAQLQVGQVKTAGIDAEFGGALGGRGQRGHEVWR